MSGATSNQRTDGPAPAERDPRVRLEIDPPIAIVTNANPERHNAFDDAMDLALFAILDELAHRRDVRAVVWRADGTSFSSGRDTSALAEPTEEIPHGELMRRGHRGIQRLFDLDAPVVVALKGWVIGGSFQRALLCDIRIAGASARFRLPELTYGVIPDTGGVAVLHQIAGHGLVSDMVLTGRVVDANEALAHGIVSRVVDDAVLDDEALFVARRIAELPFATVRMARHVIRRLALPAIRASMEDEQIGQTWVRKSDDLAEFVRARAEGRPPRYVGF
jgi:enoyl-CoA hydratase